MAGLLSAAGRPAWPLNGTVCSLRNPKSLWQRLLHESTYFASLSRGLLGRARFDAILVFCPLLGSAAFGILYKALHRVPALLDVEDLPADAAAAGGIATNHRLKALLRWIQRSLFNRYNLLRTISPVMAQRLLATTDRPVIHIPHWLHPNLARPLTALPSKLGRTPGEPIKLLYAGNLGTKQGLLELCQVLHQQPLRFQFQINVAGGCVAELTAWLQSCNDPRFSIGPVLPEPLFVRALHDTDYFVITEKPDKGASFFPSKLIPGIASGTPILTVSDTSSPLGTEILGYQLGPWCAWEQLATIAERLAAVSPTEYTQWATNALARATFYDRDIELERYLAALVALCPPEFQQASQPKWRACLHQGVQEFQLCSAEQESPPEVHAGGHGRPSAKVTQYL